MAWKREVVKKTKSAHDKMRGRVGCGGVGVAVTSVQCRKLPSSTAQSRASAGPVRRACALQL